MNEACQTPFGITRDGLSRGRIRSTVGILIFAGWVLHFAAFRPEAASDYRRT